jgi:hypothetical protein
MESITYRGWNIRAFRGDRGFETVITTPLGMIYSQSAISWPTPHSAQRYAQKFIDWYIKLENRHRDQ